MRKEQYLCLLLVLLMGMFFSFGCDSSSREIFPQSDFNFRGFGEVCGSDIECESTYCLKYEQGSVCTKLCDEGCPEGWECKSVPDWHHKGEVVSVCVLDSHRLCTMCEKDSNCNSFGADWCYQLGGQGFCLKDCSFGGCPDGYSCEDVVRDGVKARQCMPVGGSCHCDEKSDGLVRGCETSSIFGVCFGQQKCNGSQQSWGECDARVAKSEVCDGIDNNCNGFIDEEIGGGVCVNENSYGRCKGVEVCMGSEGLKCGGQVPSAEECNMYDDNCDDRIDEGFVDIKGVYYLKSHCGGCGQDCDVLMEHAKETECVVEEGHAQCRAKSCEDGYFPYMGGIVCMALPSNLCEDCSVDADCVGPNSRCIRNDHESFCARDCGKDSAYGEECPEGYGCGEIEEGVKQCLPVSGTCLCNAEHVGVSKSCSLKSCVGYQVCERSSDGVYRWSKCEINQYNEEKCDGIDNNCDGRIDEGFLNLSTGIYDKSEHCGFCFNDCSRYLKEEIAHVSLECKVESGRAYCGMGKCKREIEGGVEYEWVDVDGVMDNGCECRRILGNLENDDPDLVGNYGSGYEFLDANCDGVDGVVSASIFVRAGEKSGDGSLERPFGKISDAIEASRRVSKKVILVSEGVYDEVVSISGGVRLHGGYSRDFKSRNLVAHASVIKGSESGSVSVRAIRIKEGSLLSGFVVLGPDLGGLAAKQSYGIPSVGMWLLDSPLMEIRSNRIVGGRGSDGFRGATGKAGYGRKQSRLLDGKNGVNSNRYWGECKKGKHVGGDGGYNVECRGGAGIRGGHAVCPRYNWVNHQGGLQEYSNRENGQGLGGRDWSFDSMSGNTCSHATESGFPTAIATNVGERGKDGADGVDGRGGKGSGSIYGRIVNGFWVTSMEDMHAGLLGAVGKAGGGGGAGGGVSYYYKGIGDCESHEVGPSGGGGGAGGCGGGGGGAGGQGGASIGILISKTQAGHQAFPKVHHNLFERGVGGNGGDGGVGGVGGLGGVGGQGGWNGSWITSKGGGGGDGGNGGSGGGGGGGSGGPSFDVAGYGLKIDGYYDVNRFLYGDGEERGGQGGKGGRSSSEVGHGGDGKQGASSRGWNF